MEGSDVHEGCPKGLSAGFSLALEFTEHDHPIPSVNKLLGDSLEIQEGGVKTSKDLVGYSLWPSMDASIGIIAIQVLIPLYVLLHSRTHGRHVASCVRF